jgi:Tol biopolymer transport system component
VKKYLFIFTIIAILTTLMTIQPVSAKTNFSNMEQTFSISAISSPAGLIKISPDNNPLPAFKWNAVAGASTYEVQVDSTEWGNIGNRLTYVQPTVLAKGNHVFSVRAIDASNNTGPATSVNFYLSVVADLANTKLGFSSYRETPAAGEIFVMNSDFTNPVRLTFTVGNGVPMWSPDGTKVVFHSIRDGNYEVYVMNADGSNQTRLTNNPAPSWSPGNWFPAWSPDGTKIAFCSARDGNDEIYIMNADGSNQTRLTNNPADDNYPSWSPDATKIAFTSDRDGISEIYVMDADGSNPNRFTTSPVDFKQGFICPSWSPDGSKIAFNSGRQDGYDIYTMNIDGSNLTNLTPETPEEHLAPQWSPDGSKLTFAYEETISYPWTMAIMNSDGSNLNVIMEGRPNGGPSWSPFLTSSTPSQPIADFIGTPLEGTAPLPVQFTDKSTGNITSWSWNFGDGGTSTLQNPLYQYDTAGIYIVSLTVSGPGGMDTETKNGYIHVGIQGAFILNVPFFSQRDPLWKDNLVGQSGSTISQIGCAMTSCAMVLKYFEVNTNPAILNDWLSSNTNNGYATSGAIYWAKPAEYSNEKMQFVSSGGSLTDNDNWAVLESELIQEYPVIVQVDFNPSTSALDEHWVVVIGKQGDEYLINDPWDLSGDPDDVSPNNLLSDFYDQTYDNTFFKWRVYHPDNTPPPPNLSVSVTTSGSFLYNPGYMTLFGLSHAGFYQVPVADNAALPIEINVSQNGSPVSNAMVYIQDDSPNFPGVPLGTTDANGNANGLYHIIPSFQADFTRYVNIVVEINSWQLAYGPIILYKGTSVYTPAIQVTADMAQNYKLLDFFLNYIKPGPSDFIDNERWNGWIKLLSLISTIIDFNTDLKEYSPKTGDSINTDVYLYTANGVEDDYLIHMRIYRNGQVIYDKSQWTNLQGAHPESIGIASPGELRAYDSLGHVTGLVNGQIRTEIPNTMYYPEAKRILILSPEENYVIEVMGFAEGTYGLNIDLFEQGNIIKVEAINIPISNGSRHDYYVNWNVLSQGQPGVTLQIDSNGDGIFERTVKSDSTLTANEFNPPEPTPGPEVGGEVYPNNSVAILTIGILATALLSGAGVIIRRRITQR